MNRRRALHNNSPVQQMIASVNNPSLWNINNLIKPPFISSSSSPSTFTNFLAPPNNNINTNNNLISHNYHHNHSINSLLQDHPFNNMNMSTTTSSSWLDNNHIHQEQPPQFMESWSQLLLGGGIFIGDEEKKMENWEEQVLLQQNNSPIDHVKQEISVNSDTNISNNNNNNINININSNNTNKSVYSTNNDQEFQANWSPHHISSSPQSCVTTAINNNNNNSMLDFSSKCISDNNLHPRHDTPLIGPDQGYERDCATRGGAPKKAKVQPSSSQSTFKVRKEKLGDRITALHQLVSPFGKTDTASVLLEAIGYIRFLHSQVEALSLPYLTCGARSERHPYNVQEERKCIFPEDPGQLLDEKNCLKRKGGPDDQNLQEAKDLRSRGLCLVPIACTMHVGSDNGADYWAPTIGGSFR
ncbi:hypothetical protein RND81_06G159700 [Saponaria officinalis]|uniref:BHLH domain-containing protein n=1 Tax=Saponaria officinalis TaxID=3572 RepID=A0AAW1KB20_SAPOF